jgi:hypothetical protein
VKLRRLGIVSWLWVVALCLAVGIVAAHLV